MEIAQVDLAIRIGGDREGKFVLDSGRGVLR